MDKIGIDEAIRIVNEHCPTDVGIGSDIYWAFQMAIDSLKSKRENKDCPYCHGDEAVIDSKDVKVFVDYRGNFDAFPENGKPGRGKAKFCSECGAMLGVGSDE